MNILEGLKRLYIIFSVLALVGIGGSVWVDSDRHSCAKFERLSIAERAAELNAPCTSTIDMALTTTFVTLVSAIALIVVWLLLRWVLTGFCPTTKREK